MALPVAAWQANHPFYPQQPPDPTRWFSLARSRGVTTKIDSALAGGIDAARQLIGERALYAGKLITLREYPHQRRPHPLGIMQPRQPA